MMSFCKYILRLFVLTVCLYGTSLRADVRLNSRKLTTADGLPSNSVRSVFQDSQGFIWIGTANGLSRYDGSDFVNFQLQPAESTQPGLTASSVIGLAEDSLHFLWINCTNSFVSCYDLEKDQFVDFTGTGEFKTSYSSFYFFREKVWLTGDYGARQITIHPDRSMTSTVYNRANGKLSSNAIRFVFEDHLRHIWIGTANGLTRTRGEQMETIYEGSGFMDCISYQNKLFFVTDKGEICTWEDNRLNFIPLSQKPDSYLRGFRKKDQWIFLAREAVWRFDLQTYEIERDRNLFLRSAHIFRTSEGGHLLFNQSEHLIYVGPEDDDIYHIHLDPDNTLQRPFSSRFRMVRGNDGVFWISSNMNGLFSFNPSNRQLEHYTSSIHGDILPGDQCNDIFMDNLNNLWIGLGRAGLVYLSIQKDYVSRFFPHGEDQFDNSNNVRVVYPGKNGLYASTRSGELYTYDTLFNEVDVENYDSNIYSLAFDSTGSIWKGFRGRGLMVDDNRIMNEPDNSRSLINNNVVSLYCDSKGRMWVGTFGGGLDLAEADPQSGYIFRHFIQGSAGQKNIRDICGDPEGNIWLATSEGLCVFHPDSLIKNPNHYLNFSYRNGKFCANEVISLLCAHDHIWAGTIGNGLVKCRLSDDKSELIYRNITTRQGLANNNVASLCQDYDGFLWAGTEYGITRFDPKDENTTNFYFASNMPGNAYSEKSSCLLPDHRLVFGTDHGLTVIDPEELQNDQPISPPVFTDFLINGSSIFSTGIENKLEQALSYTHDIILKHYENSLEIHFTSFDYSNTHRFHYQFKLEGYDKDWSPLSAGNFASYKYLPYGKYDFRVTGKGANSQLIPEASIRISILPPWWKTPWAKSLWLFIAISLTAFTVIYYNRREKERNQIRLERQLTEYKLQFFTNLSHEFRTPLTLLSVSLEKMMGVSNIPAAFRNPVNIMSKGIGRMQRLLNQIMELRRIQEGKPSITLQKTDVVSFVHNIFSAFTELADKKHLGYNYVSDSESFELLTDRGHLDKIVYNLISNAFKYTPDGGSINVSLTHELERSGNKNDTIDGWMVLKVIDSGTGISKEEQAKLFSRFHNSFISNDSVGIGLNLSFELIKLLKGDIGYQDRAGGGSVFTVRLPYGHILWQDDEKVRILDEAGRLFPLNTLETISNTDFTASDELVVQPVNDQKILIIEDDADIRSILESELGRYFIIYSAEDGNSGLQTAIETYPDLIVCDVLMPGMNGFEVTQKLRNQFQTSHIPIILLTALSDTEHQIKGFKYGADAYVSKPFNINILKARIFQIINQRQRLREKFSSEPRQYEMDVYATDHDKSFLEQLNKVLEENLDNSEFSIEDLSKSLCVSHTVLYNKVKGITGKAPVEYFRLYRLKKAAGLILNQPNLNMNEISFKVGFNDSLYFSRCFKKQFGVSPSAYKKKP